MRFSLQKKQIYISDTIHNTILISIYEKEVISTQLFNRLHNISQNSTAYLTFPTNKTKRFEHSLGTMKLCGDILYHSIVNSDYKTVNSLISSFKTDIQRSVIDDIILKQPNAFRSILDDKNIEKDKLYQFENLSIENVFFNSYIPSNIKTEDRFTYLLMFQSVRLCGLLHDLGHPPFSHITESAIHNVYLKIKEKKDKNHREAEFYDIFEEYGLDKKSSQLHEIMGNKMTEALISDLLYGSSQWHSGLSFDEKYFKVLALEIVKVIFSEESPVLTSLHGVVDGVIDGDRLDYVNRDIINSGINNGRIEYDRLISSMKLFPKDDYYFFVSSAKTINTLEDFFIKRWNLYKNIIYHHRVIKTDSFLKNSLEHIILDYLKQNDDSILQQHRGSAAETDNTLPTDISGLWKAVRLAHSNSRYFNSLAQWDDAWLQTILKRVYFEKYYDSSEAIRYQLEEILSTRKNFYSVIKNCSDFNILSDSFEKTFMENNFSKQKDFEKIKSILDSKRATILYKVEAFIEAYTSEKSKFTHFIKESISEFISNNFSDRIESHTVEFKKIKTGFDKIEPNIYKDEELVPISKVSNMKYTLTSEKYTLSFVHIYLKFKSFETRFLKDDFTCFLHELGKNLAEKTIFYLEQILEKKKD